MDQSMNAALEEAHKEEETPFYKPEQQQGGSTPTCHRPHQPRARPRHHEPDGIASSRANATGSDRSSATTWSTNSPPLRPT